MSPAALLLDSSLAAGGLDGIAQALVAQAFDTGPVRAHGVPEPGKPDPGDTHADPRDPRPPHKPGDTQPVDAPPVPRLRPLE